MRHQRNSPLVRTLPASKGYPGREVPKKLSSPPGGGEDTGEGAKSRRFARELCKRYEVVEPGFKYNMMDLQAALGLHQLQRVEANLRRRQEIWVRYQAAFADLPVLFPQAEQAGTRHVRHLFTLLLDIDRLRVGRDDIQLSLHRQRIGTGIHSGIAPAPLLPRGVRVRSRRFAGGGMGVGSHPLGTAIR